MNSAAEWCILINMQHKAKKSLGQNFLKSHSALMAILDEGDVHADDIVLEIGPGKGALTEKLIALAGKVIAVEKDDDLFAYLKEKFADAIEKKKLDLIHGDILEFDPAILSFYKQPYKLIANIPYNITGAILKQFLASDTQPERMVLLVQKEVAERIVARDGKESILSMSVKAYGTPKYVVKVPARYFSPAPKVDSAIIAITAISKKHFTNIKEEERFFEIMKAGFAHKRKLLSGNLKPLIGDSSALFAACSIDPKARAEELTLANWLCLTKGI